MRRADQAEVPLVDQVREGDALVLVLLRDRHHETEVAAHQLVEGFLLLLPDAPGEVDFFLLRDQRIPADLAQVLIQRAVIGGRSALGRADLNWTHAGQPRWPYAALAKCNLSRAGRIAQPVIGRRRSAPAAACRSSPRSIPWFPSRTGTLPTRLRGDRSRSASRPRTADA